MALAHGINGRNFRWQGPHTWALAVENADVHKQMFKVSPALRLLSIKTSLEVRLRNCMGAAYSMALRIRASEAGLVADEIAANSSEEVRLIQVPMRHPTGRGHDVLGVLLAHQLATARVDEGETCSTSAPDSSDLVPAIALETKRTSERVSNYA